MKRLFSILTIISLFLILSACGGGDTPESVMNNYLDLMDNYMNDMEKADSADDIVDVLEAFSKKMETLAPRMKAIMEKHPELKGMKGGKLPEEYKDINDRMQKIMPRMMGVFGKMMKYGNDPKVKEAQKKFQEAMSSFE